MKKRGKFMESQPDFNDFSSSSDLPCKKHPLNSSSIGICAYCLEEKLQKLVCSDCGEQRISSCSCSDLSSYRNSSCNMDVGRISFLIENEKDEQKTLFSHMKQSKKSETGDAVSLKRSNSCVLEVKKSIGFWKFGNLFKKKREKEGGFDQKYDSRSVTSFMDGKFDHEVSSVGCSSAKVSDFNEAEPRKSGFRGGLMDLESGFSLKESDFSNMDDDSEFIDLKIDLSEKSKTEESVMKVYDPLDSFGGGFGSSSCRITVNERGIKKVKNSHMKAWKWIFKHHSHSGKKDLNYILES